MKKNLKMIYFALPISLQNIVFTFVNCIVLKKKYGVFLARNESNNIFKGTLDNAELKKTYAEFVDLISKNPFYKSKCQFYDLANMNKNQITTKEEFRKNIKVIKSANIFSPSIKFQTSGTSGAPISGLISKKCLHNRYKNILGWMHSNGVRLNSTWCRFAGQEICSSKSDDIFRKDLLNNHYYFSIFKITDQNATDYFNYLKEINAEIIEGYPSVLCYLVSIFRKKKLFGLTIKAVIVTAETLSTDQKEILQDYFECKILNFYGSSEMSPLMVSNDDGYLELVNSTGIIELLNPSGEVIRTKGEIGSMIVTSFDSKHTPLFRYEVGDLAEYESGEAHNLIVKNVHGRLDDSIVLPNGKYVSRISLFLKELPSQIKMSQIVIEDGIWNLRYISDTEIPAKEFSNFFLKLNNLYDVEKKYINLIKVDKLIHEPSGKLKMFKIL